MTVQARKRLLQDRACLLEAWDQAFPHHDFGTGRLSPDTSPAEEVWGDPGWARAAREYHKARAGRRAAVDIMPERLALLRQLLSDDVSIERAWNKLNDPRRHPTPQVVVEAIWWCVRERGVAALNEPANLERLSHCDDAALAQLDARLAKLKGNAP